MYHLKPDFITNENKLWISNFHFRDGPRWELRKSPILSHEYPNQTCAPLQISLCSKPEFITKKDKLCISNFNFSFQRQAQVELRKPLIFSHIQIKLVAPFEDSLCSKPEFRTKDDKLWISNFHSFILEMGPGGNYANHSYFHINIQIKLLHPFKYPLCSKPDFRTKKDKLWISNVHFFILETGPGGNCANHSSFHINSMPIIGLYIKNDHVQESSFCYTGTTILVLQVQYLPTGSSTKLMCNIVGLLVSLLQLKLGYR